MSLFRNPLTGALDREYLRICAVHRLLKKQRIGRSRAIALLSERKVEKPRRLVELWCNNTLRHTEIAP